MRTNIVKVTLGRLTTVSKKQLWKEDYGQKVQFIGVDLPYRYEVDFADSPTGQAITMIGDETGVLVPDELLQKEGTIYAYLYLHTGSDDGETQYTVILPVEQRAERTDIEPTPVQQNIIEQAIVALNDAVEQTAQDVTSAGESAEAAGNAAEAAERAKDQAVEAKGKAEEAQEGAETAQGKAEDAQRAAEQAAGSVLGLTADATVDANVGTPSVEVEVTTESDHKNMSFAFHNLKGVQGDTGVGISSVVLNADYTLTITLTNGTSYTTTSIRGEVGATPNLTIGTVSTLPEGSQATATITGTDEDPVLNLGIPVGDTGDPGISPTITVTEISGGHEVEVVDAEGTQTFEVMDGEVSEQDLEDALIDKADIITSTASGDIVTIEDGANDLPVVDLKLSLLPVQDLHGQDAPYPAGGGKNLFPYPVSKDETVANVRFVSDGNGKITITGTASQNGFCNFALVNSFVIPDGQSYKVCFLNSEAKGHVGFYNGSTNIDQWGMNAVNRASNYTLMSGSNCDSIRFLVSSGVAYNMTLQIMFVANSYATTAYIPYSNVCLISGWTGVEVDQAKKNLLEPKFYSGIVYNPNVGASAVTTLTDVTNTVTKEGNTYSKTGSEWDVPMSMVLPLTDAFVGKTLKFSGTINEISGFRCAWIITDSEYITKRKATIMSTKPTWSITIQKGDAYLIWYMNSSSAGTYTLTEPQIEVGSTATAYEPYNGNTYPISWQSEAGTVYGGSLDVTSGVLTVNLSAINANSISWVKPSTQNNANGTIFTCDNVTVPFIGWASVDFSKTLSNAFVHAERNANTAGSANNTFWWNNASTGYRVIWGSPNGASSYDDFIAFLTNNNVMFVGELASPQTFQLSETQIATFLGNNSFWSNGNGVVDLEYRCDTKLYIENLTKPTEDDMTANANIASGKFFTVGNRLFLSSVAIGQGETIIPGTNCSEISLADALNQINS